MNKLKKRFSKDTFYAIYSGEECIEIDTKENLIKKYGYNEFYYMTSRINLKRESDTYKKNKTTNRFIGFPIEDDEEEE